MTPGEDPAKELKALQARVSFVLAHVEGRSISEIARTQGSSRPTVRKWVQRFQAYGVEGLVSESPPGRPKEISEAIKEDCVRLPTETRPPLRLLEKGQPEQWTAELLAKALGVSVGYVAEAWREADFSPIPTLQQAMQNPFRRTALGPWRIRTQQWFRLFVELLCRERGISVDDYVFRAIVGEKEWQQDEHRREALDQLPEMWQAWNSSLPRSNPRNRWFKDPEEER